MPFLNIYQRLLICHDNRFEEHIFDLSCRQRVAAALTLMVPAVESGEIIEAVVRSGAGQVVDQYENIYFIYYHYTLSSWYEAPALKYACFGNGRFSGNVAYLLSMRKLTKHVVTAIEIRDLRIMACVGELNCAGENRLYRTCYDITINIDAAEASDIMRQYIIIRKKHYAVLGSDNALKRHFHFSFRVAA